MLDGGAGSVKHIRQISAIGLEEVNAGPSLETAFDVVVGCSDRDTYPVVLTNKQNGTWLSVQRCAGGGVEPSLSGGVVYGRITERAVDDRV